MAIDGKTFALCCISAANALKNSEVSINNLNVFPVPDGDTGSNMYRTMAGAMSAADYGGSVGGCAEFVSGKLLHTARGNSGAILSLYFRGFAKALRGLETANVYDIARAMTEGTIAAYSAVVKPAEGTMLTVMRCCSERAAELSQNFEGTDTAFFELLYATSADVLSKTTEMLPVLKQANVVDAGGLGFLTIIEGFLCALRGTPIEKVDFPDERELTPADFSIFSSADIAFKYCVECIVKKSAEYSGEGTAAPLLSQIETCGDSIVFIDTDTHIKLHIHSNTPSVILDSVRAFGDLEAVKIENMSEQHTELISAGTQKQDTFVTPSKKYGFVFVCAGKGFESIFRDLSADRLVFGGQTMNPSTDEILSAVAMTPAETVFIFPGNKNIKLVAAQAAELTRDRTAIVIPTESLPQSVSAALAFDGDLSPEENAEAMTAAAESIRTLSVAKAVKNADIGKLHISVNQYMALLDGDIVSVADTPEDCLTRLGGIFESADYINIYYGADFDRERAEKTAGIIEALAPDAEAELISGGQPLYELLISIEA